MKTMESLMPWLEAYGASNKNIKMLVLEAGLEDKMLLKILGTDTRKLMLRGHHLVQALGSHQA